MLLGEREIVLHVRVAIEVGVDVAVERQDRAARVPRIERRRPRAESISVELGEIVADAHQLAEPRGRRLAEHVDERLGLVEQPRLCCARRVPGAIHVQFLRRAR